MCELFAMNANRPAEVGGFLNRLMPRGGITGPHADGWGVAYFEGRAARVFKDPSPAAQSPLLATLAHQDLRSTAVVAHIRKANPSVFGRATANTHPFERECFGRSWVFAHNGKLPGIHEKKAQKINRFLPLGDTDSELAFCIILEAIADRIESDGPLMPQVTVGIIRPVVKKLMDYGEFNFILCDGEHIFVHAHTRLHALQKHACETGDATMTVLATEPLTRGCWRPLQPGSIHVYKDGRTLM